MLADQPLSPRNVAFQGGDTQFVVFNPQAQFPGNYLSRAVVDLLSLSGAQLSELVSNVHRHDALS
jgi:hypothetical protein